MKYCVQAHLIFNNAVRRDAVLADAQTRVLGKQRWGVERLEAGRSKSGGPAINIELRFAAKADSEDLKARIEAFATGQFQPQPGSWVHIHDCNHDEGDDLPPCVIESKITW